VLGVVKDLLSTGPQTVLVLSQALEGKTIERMIPFVDAYIDSVDLPGKTIVADWQLDY
jgi:16S rRNA processing protein RimM